MFRTLSKASWFHRVRVASLRIFKPHLLNSCYFSCLNLPQLRNKHILNITISLSSILLISYWSAFHHVINHSILSEIKKCVERGPDFVFDTEWEINVFRWDKITSLVRLIFCDFLPVKMASNKRKQDEKHLKMLREMVALPSNKTCFDCHQRGPTYVNMTIGSFVCTSCSGILWVICCGQSQYYIYRRDILHHLRQVKQRIRPKMFSLHFYLELNSIWIVT